MTQVKTFAELTGKDTFLSTLPESNDKAGKLKIHKAINTKAKIKDIKGKFDICGVYATKVDVRDRATKEIQELTRVVIVDKDLNAYASTTATMSRAIADLCESLWYPDMENALPIAVIEGKSEKGTFYTVDIAQ